MDNCPACERRFEGINDFPIVYITSVSIIKPQDVPKAVPNWYHEDMLEKETEGWNRKIVPSQVLNFFKRSPDKDELVHSEFVYTRPWEDQKENRGLPAKALNRPKFWHTSFNFAPFIKKLMTENTSVKQYFSTLDELVGHEVQTLRVIPSWQYYSHHQVYTIPDSGAGLMLQLSESKEKPSDNRVTELHIHCQGPNAGRAGGASTHELLKIGEIQYEGRIRK